LSNEIFVPTTEAELFEFLEKNGPHSKIVSGATDVLPRIRRGQEKTTTLVDISRIESFRYLERENGVIRIGALCTLNDLIGSGVLGSEYEAFRNLSLAFGSPPIRNLATVGGNLAASSSSEDLIPILLTLDARVNVKSLNLERVIPLAEFIRGKRRTALISNQILTEVSFDELRPNSWCTFEKVGRRERVIISLVSLACTLTLNRRSGAVDQVRIALNRIRGKIPERAIATEENLLGKIISEPKLDEACKVLESELSLTSDFRASAQYRTRVAKNLLRESLMHCKQCITQGTK
jgi:CO/xanthine dehydrogenase FAD-binding subunit